MEKLWTSIIHSSDIKFFWKVAAFLHYSTSTYSPNPLTNHGFSEENSVPSHSDASDKMIKEKVKMSLIQHRVILSESCLSVFCQNTVKKHHRGIYKWENTCELAYMRTWTQCQRGWKRTLTAWKQCLSNFTSEREYADHLELLFEVTIWATFIWENHLNFY